MLSSAQSVVNSLAVQRFTNLLSLVVNMALGQKRFRLRDSLQKNSFVNKKLDFQSGDFEDVNMMSISTPVLQFNNCDTFSPCHTRSGTVYKPKTLKFGDLDRSSDSDSDVSVFEETKLQPLDGFDNEMSPIVNKQSLMNKSKMSPCFLRRRPRTSTRILPAINSQECTVSEDANTNPYSPVVTKRFKRHHSSSSISSSVSDCDSDDSGRCSPLPEKKLRVSDLSISRYEQEFVQMAELASGEYGSVKLARHRLDGTDYAIKVNKTPLKPGSYLEKKAMNEVFAHASLNSNQHVVRYFNSWVEDGHVYIQNEFCNGGSFSKLIDDRRESGDYFSEEELKTVLSQSLKGLKYIHSKHMAHMDIKPDNILVSVEKSFNVEKSDISTDSGAESDDPSSLMKKMDIKEDMAGEDVQTFKIGDLGHVTSLTDGSLAPEEGDCRYMAPELFLMDVDRSQLQKADIFSLGLTLYEAASLTSLPKNSFDGSLYEELRNGQLPYLSNYSKRFNHLISSMIQSKPSERPSASKLIKQVSIMNKKSEIQLCKELRASQRRLEELQNLLNNSY